MSDYSDWKSHQDPNWRPAKPQSGATLMNDKQALREILRIVRDAGALDDNNGGEDWAYSDIAIDKALAKLDAYTEQRVREKLEKIKTEMRMHTVPEGRDLITRSYLENTIDFELAQLKASTRKEDK